MYAADTAESPPSQQQRDDGELEGDDLVAVERERGRGRELNRVFLFNRVCERERVCVCACVCVCVQCTYAKRAKNG